MRKSIALLLVITMGLSLLGCNTGNTELTTGNDTPEGSGQSSTTTGDTVSSTEDTSSATEPELTAAAEMWLERIPGEYKGCEDFGDVEPRFPAFTLNADKTCTFGDDSYTWDLGRYWGEYDCDEGSAVVFINNDEGAVYKLSLHLEKEDYISTALYTVSSDGHGANSTPGSYYNMTNIEVLEITLDNWADYFAELDDITVTTDAFGDVTGMDIYKYIALKEEYGYAIGALSEVIVEHTCINERRMITADTEKKTYTWGETTFTGISSTFTFPMANYLFEEEGEEHFGLLPAISYIHVDTFPEDEVDINAFKDVVRITGTVYCVPAK